ncbi:MAG: hypothetical protein FWD05_14785 [Oscillospiraceae bacterium]|nr:hypothetical protein [Oscillospiraceae bacterium]
MVKVKGYWKVQVACLIVFAITIAVLWIGIDGSSNQETSLISSYATTCIFNIFIEDDATKRLVEVIRYVS